MFLDASAIHAILAEEDDAAHLLAKIENHGEQLHYSPLSAYEAIMSLARRRTDTKFGDQVPVPVAELDHAQDAVMRFLAAIGAKETSIDGSAHKVAIEATRAFGKLVGHPARLNFGDCFAYASAKTYRLPLLFKGNDFTQTDIERA